MSEATNIARVEDPEKSTVTVGLVVALVVFPLIVLMLVGSYFFEVAREPARRADCQAAMKGFGLDFKRYASESEEGMWPMLVSTDGAWVPELEPLYGKYRHVTNPANMVSIFHPDKNRLKRELAEAWKQPVPDFDKAARIFAESFGYLGYMIQSEADFEALRLARSQNAILPDGTLPPAMNPGMVFPLREGVERFLITHINGPASSLRYQSAIPVLIEIATWKYKESVEDFEGTNVLFMDGHVELVPLGTFPVLTSILDALIGS